MASPPEVIIAEVGKRLAQPRLNKDTLVKLLKVSTDSPKNPNHPHFHYALNSLSWV